MNRVFLDANILLDLIDNQRQGHQAALKLEALMVRKNLSVLLAWHSLSIIAYIGRKQFGEEGIQELIKGLLNSFSVPKTGSEEAELAFKYFSGDFEDAMQIAAAVAGRADFLVTRDATGFQKSPIRVVTAEELAEILAK